MKSWHRIFPSDVNSNTRTSQTYWNLRYLFSFNYAMHSVRTVQNLFHFQYVVILFSSIISIFLCKLELGHIDVFESLSIDRFRFILELSVPSQIHMNHIQSMIEACEHVYMSAPTALGFWFCVISFSPYSCYLKRLYSELARRGPVRASGALTGQTESDNAMLTKEPWP